MSATQTQPRTTKLSFKSILSLPFRLCNPPPAVAKVRSCGVTPVFQVQLDDILERKHLPPLGLKDFEEWLLYCENSVENLYFILWLKEYTLKYKQWVARTAFERENAGDYRIDWPLHSSSQLAMFYARAKSTFFTPNAAYELNLPSVAFAPFHASNGSPHPDPVIFTEIAIETRKMLDESLGRFVTAQFSNVGNRRVLCGMIAGVLFCLLGGLTPIAYNFAHGHSRWIRLAALPGIWLGLTVLLASLNGVCIGVYIFGDLRQLRKFELSRPAISKPQPLRIPRPRPMISYPITGITPVPPVVQPRLAIIPPSPAHIHSPRSPSRMSPSSSARSSFESQSSCTGGTHAIHISPAYYDADPVEGPATSPVAPDVGAFTLPTKRAFSETESGTDSFAATASFIHPFDELPEDDYQFGGPPRTLPEHRQLLSAFDFDALPRCAYGATPQQSQPRNVIKIEPEARPVSKLRLSPRALIERMQSKCVTQWSASVGRPPMQLDAQLDACVEAQPGEKVPHRPRDSLDSSSRPHLDLPQHTRTRVDESTVRKQFKLVRAVPAFASPLTPVLSSIVVRGQWEIVTRSAVIALFLCWAILGSMLAIPPSRR